MPLPSRRTPTPPAWHPLALLLLLALWLTTVGNLPFWAAVWHLPQSQDWIALLTGLNLGLLLLALNVAALSLLIWPRWRRSGGIVLLFMATAASYFMHAYGVVIDASMLRNALATHAREVRDLLSGGMLVALLLGVLLPGWWWWRQPVRPVPARRLMAQQLGVSALALLMVFFLGWASFQDLASLVRNHKPMRYMINPYNSVYALGRNMAGSASRMQQPLQAIGEDAALPLKAGADPQPSPLIVLVVGETARAANFGLGGYQRDTTPRLRDLQAQGRLVYFSQVSSCGTNTEDSVPCMFSHLGRENYVASAARYENLLDVLRRAGLAVLWLDNQSGCKGVCDRVPHVDTSSLSLPGVCKDDECLDEVMLHELPARLAALDPARRAHGTVVVLHQMGSHGPAYHKRAPEALKAFQPECTQAALQDCPREHIVNAYDNSIRYTDHFLAEVTLWLQAQQRPTALLYVSDHGESLGEKGLYLHGMPYRMASREQTHVPMLLWVSTSMQERLALDLGCLKSAANQPISHDHLFHTMLSLGQVRTRARDPQRDVLDGCQPHLKPTG
jgi:lipid A ethanolaminephosphotransferase